MPDIGGFKDVPVIEVFVKPGDVVKVDDPLMTLESDKATMDVPSPLAGTVEGVRVAVGEKVSEGTVIATLIPAAAVGTAPQTPPAVPAPARAAAPPPAAAPAPLVAPATAAVPAAQARTRNRHAVGRCARLALGTQVRARAGRRSRQGQGHRAEGPHPAPGRAGVRQGRARRPLGVRRVGVGCHRRRRYAQPAAVAAGGLRQVRARSRRSRCRASGRSPARTSPATG